MRGAVGVLAMRLLVLRGVLHSDVAVVLASTRSVHKVDWIRSANWNVKIRTNGDGGKSNCLVGSSD